MKEQNSADDRFFENQCEELLKDINRVANAPHNGEEWIQDDAGEWVANVGAYMIEYPAGGPKLCRIYDKHGSLSTCTPPRPPREAFLLMQVFFGGLVAGVKQ
jgi:hypothetical protein